MKTSDTQKSLVAALLAARAAFPAIPKTKTGQSGNRHFKYAPLDDVFAAVMPFLFENGLLLTQGTEGHELVTRLDHISGEWRESRMPINAEHANMQSYGIELTYRRRYAIQPMLGIITEEDTDGRGARDRKGIDHTKPTDAGGVISGPAEAYKALTEDWQAYVDSLATEVENTFTSAGPAAAQEIITINTERDDLGPDELAALYYKLGSKTRSALKGLTK